MSERRIQAKITGPDQDTAYIKLPGFPNESKAGCVAKTVRLDLLIDPYAGPMVNLDFNAEGRLIGIEILTFDD